MNPVLPSTTRDHTKPTKSLCHLPPLLKPPGAHPTIKTGRRAGGGRARFLRRPCRARLHRVRPRLLLGPAGPARRRGTGAAAAGAPAAAAGDCAGNAGLYPAGDGGVADRDDVLAHFDVVEHLCVARAAGRCMRGPEAGKALTVPLQPAAVVVAVVISKVGGSRTCRSHKQRWVD